MTDDAKKSAGMMATHNTQAFELDDRSIGARLDAFREYCQRLPYTDVVCLDGDSDGWPPANWAQVIFGYAAGTWAKDASPTAPWHQAGEVAWAFERERLVQLYENPELADGQLPPERAFLLSLLGMLETPRGLFNQFPAQHRSMYYQQMLALEARQAKPDQVTVNFTLADGVREQVLPAGLRLEAGQDSAGNTLQYALMQPLTVNMARVTDLRWVVADACTPGGCRARVVFDESAEQPWPVEGVRLFGASPVRPGEQPRADADRVVEHGRIVESSVLSVAGGERTWIVELQEDLPGESPLCAAISMAETWVVLPCVQGTSRKWWSMTLPSNGGIPTAVTTLDGLVSTLPLLRLLSAEGEDVPRVKNLTVKVQGAVGVLCARDDGTVLSEGGLPFGERAKAGSGVNLMSPEWWLLGPKLTQVTCTPTWTGLPTTSFSEWYGPDATQAKPHWLLLDQDLNVTRDPVKGKVPDSLNAHKKDTLASRVTNGEEIAAQIMADNGYPSVGRMNQPKNDYFSVDGVLIHAGKPPSEGQSLSLFGGSEKPEGQPLTMSLKNVPSATPTSTVPDDEDPACWPWYLRLQLKTSLFLHDEYDAHEAAPLQIVRFQTEQAHVQQVPAMKQQDGHWVYEMVEVAGADGKKISMPAMKEERVTFVTPVPVTVPKAQRHPPYTPQWAGMRIDYQATDAQVDQRVILPFGLPRQEMAKEVPPHADVYLGLEGIEAGQLLTLHWQLKSPGAFVLKWQYLAVGERWMRLSVNDATDGWQSSGILSADWPGDVCRASTCLPAGRMWIRGRVSELLKPDRDLVALPTAPWLTGIATNAGLARLQDETRVADAHFAAGLSAGSITQGLDMPDTVQSVTQRWRSFGGCAAETHTAFEARVARRLRHRERGLNNLDLMMLLQTWYDGLRELAVLPSPKPEVNGSLSQTIVVMPTLALSDSTDPCRPGLSQLHLDDMAMRLKAVSSPWLKLSCVNPQYIPVSVSWDVTYAQGISLSTGNQRVQAALEAAFLPWMYPVDNALSVIGRPVTHGAVHDILRQLPEVTVIKHVYLNGDNQKAPTLLAEQIAVLSCIPLEYTGLTLAWENPKRERFGECWLKRGEEAIVQLMMPIHDQEHGVSHKPIEVSHADVYLIDRDTGLRLPDTMVTSLSEKERQEYNANAKEDQGQYADPRGYVPDDNSRRRYFRVHAPLDACGIFRIGATLTVGTKTLQGNVSFCIVSVEGGLAMRVLSKT
ncbi:hypothetical protein BSQ98_25610 [Serratia liquefaciens]|uniref:hypothetical protein n=1 Tax=Serratia TaxID=613 RepID=UPI0010211D0E|nr:hypothetical protein [Serratia liquefaciens]RYM57736.1 hypothetical protein BSQ98_25610 [Serratia liquefaciens]